MTRHDKLVRDDIPDIIERAGKRPVVRFLGEAEYRRALCAKLVEEATEVAGADDDSILSELADLAEVLNAALTAFDIEPADLLARRNELNAERGAFTKRIFLESVADALDSD